MCGIVGVIGDFDRETCLTIVQRMNDAIVHRGPDDSGVWSEDGFGFGVRRLSIIDIAGGHQPMSDKGSDWHVVFNGEIYNYRDLQAQLVSRGEHLETNCDTEVVLKGLATQGTQAVHGWNGMFAVAGWNSRSKRLLLIRDRIGVKPLYYYWHDGLFLFASEIKAILASGLVDPKVNVQTVWDYLTYRYVSSPETVWEGIRKLPPGHTLEIASGGTPSEVRYWKSDVVHDDTDHRSEKQLDKEFEELFFDAVKLRLTAADVPIGILLSGGLDSSAIAVAAAELGFKNLHTFSVGFEDGGYFSELPYARLVASQVGSNHHEVIIGQKDFIELLPQVVYHLDEPLADLPAVPLFALSRLASQHVKAVLSGDGCDEVFAGYEDMALDERRWEVVRSLQNLPNPLLKFASFCSAMLPTAYRRKVRHVANTPLANWYQRDYPNMTRLLSESQKTALWPSVEAMDSKRLLAALYETARSKEPLEQLLAVFQKDWLVEDLLMKTDKMSMATSLEIRTPFLDYRLVEWANRTPKSVKIKRTSLLKYETKSILRRFCERRLPKTILNRPKRGFPVPAHYWLRNGLEEWSQDILLGKDSRLGRAFSREALTDLLAKVPNGRQSDSDNIWLLLVLEFWLRVWNTELMEKPSSRKAKKALIELPVFSLVVAALPFLCF